MAAHMETLPDGRLIFTGTESFEAVWLAEKWCRDNGISYGSSQRGYATGLLRGDFTIAKWGNLTAAERDGLHGTMTGDFRNGPVCISMRRPFSPDGAQSQGGAK